MTQSLNVQRVERELEELQSKLHDMFGTVSLFNEFRGFVSTFESDVIDLRRKASDQIRELSGESAKLVDDLKEEFKEFQRLANEADKALADLSSRRKEEASTLDNLRKAHQNKHTELCGQMGEALSEHKGEFERLSKEFDSHTKTQLATIPNALDEQEKKLNAVLNLFEKHLAAYKLRFGNLEEGVFLEVKKHGDGLKAELKNEFSALELRAKERVLTAAFWAALPGIAAIALSLYAIFSHH